MSEETPRRKRRLAGPAADVHEIKPPKATATLGKDSAFAKLRERAGKAFEKRGGSTKRFTRRSMSSHLIGMPSPSLALSYGLGSNVIPFGRVAQLVGTPGSFKSALLFDLMRMVLELAETGLDDPFDLFPGTVQYNENESKLALDFLWSMMEHRDHYDNGVIDIQETKFQDDWIANQMKACADWEALYKDIGWIMPHAVAVDSISGTASREERDAMIKRGGTPGRAFPISALYLTQFSKMLPSMIGGRPILYLATNHVKRFTDQQTLMEKRNVPGGIAFQHVESMELELSRVRDVRHNTLPGANVAIRFHKNCFGDSRRKIEVPIRWTYDTVDYVDDATGEVKQQKRQWTMWDWPTASIMLLKGIAESGEKKGGDKQLAAKIAEIVDLNISQGRVWSTALGVPSSSRLSVHETGCLLEESHRVLEDLLPVLGINRGVFFEPGTDFAVERARDDVQPTPMDKRVFRRPIANGMASAIADDVDTAEYLSARAAVGFSGDFEEGGGHGD